MADWGVKRSELWVVLISMKNSIQESDFGSQNGLEQSDFILTPIGNYIIVA